MWDLQLDVTLNPVSGGEEPGQRMRGRVVDVDGEPVPGAIVRDSRALSQEPFRGAEPPVPSGDIQVTGTVVDAGTGEPLPSFTLTDRGAPMFTRSNGSGRNRPGCLISSRSPMNIDNL